MTPIDRRGWLRALPAAVGGLLAVPGHRALAAQQRQGAADPLPNPDWVGRPRSVVDSVDDDRAVVAAEHRLRCTCGCGLDVFTCRTTDFTCTYSPALHREAVALVEQGKTPDQVVEAFVAKYSETILMAPRNRGFGRVGYWLPGGALAIAAAILIWILLRRTERASVAAPAAGRSAAGDLSSAEQARLDQALHDIER